MTTWIASGRCCWKVDFDAEERIFSTAAPQLRRIGISYRDGYGRCVRDIENIYRLAVTVDETLLEAMESDVDGSDPLTIVYTSGSTSAPKGVVHTHAALLGHQRNLNEIRGLSAQDKLFCNSPFFWIGGIGFALLATLRRRVHAGVLQRHRCRRDPRPAGGRKAHHDQWVRSRDRPPRAPRQPCRSRPVVDAQRQPLSDHGARRATRRSRIAAQHARHDRDRQRQPAQRRRHRSTRTSARIVRQARARIRHQDRRARTPARSSPEATSANSASVGLTSCSGYYRRSREDCFDADGWFHTGDLVRTDPDGFHYFVGRRDSMIKTAGANVAPAEVERAIARVTGGAVAHVVGIPDAERGQIVAAVVVAEDGTEFDESALRDALKPELSAYKIPEAVRRAVPRRSAAAVQRQGRPAETQGAVRCLTPTPSTGWSDSAPRATAPSRR